MRHRLHRPKASLEEAAQHSFRALTHHTTPTRAVIRSLPHPHQDLQVGTLRHQARAPRQLTRHQQLLRVQPRLWELCLLQCSLYFNSPHISQEHLVRHLLPSLAGRLRQQLRSVHPRRPALHPHKVVQAHLPRSRTHKQCSTCSLFS